jgi:sec-independent protein translocase protein TatA
MNIFGIGLPELAVIAAIALLVFGPKRLPEMGRSLGRTLRGFQSASQEFEKAFRVGLQPEDVEPNPARMPPPSESLSPASASPPNSALGPIPESQPSATKPG